MTTIKTSIAKPQKSALSVTYKTDAAKLPKGGFKPTPTRTKGTKGTAK
ncbi:MAG: hypothetical protein WDO74_04730 [Pseudomonadota bacterium]